MEKCVRVCFENSLIRSLNSCDELVQAEMFHFRTLLEEFGKAAASIPTYSFVGEAGGDRWAIWLKLRGTWTPFWLIYPEADLIVVCARERPPLKVAR